MREIEKKRSNRRGEDEDSELGGGESEESPSPEKGKTMTSEINKKVAGEPEPDYY